MNFVTKNLGWILLLLFFLFMLFVISSNNGETPKIQSGALIESTDTGDAHENLDDLVDMIDADIDGNQDLDIKDVEKELSDVDENIEKEESLFSKIFSRKDIGDDISTEEEEGKTESGAVVIKTNKEGEIVTPREELIGLAGQDNMSSNQNIIKISGANSNASYTDTAKYSPEVLTYNYPGVNLETKIGKNFEIGVYSLKLNNKYFNKTLGYMMKGDTIKQLTQENSYGCFEVEILESQLSHNIGAIGYVCKKYLQDTDGAVVKDIPAETPVIPEVKISVDTNIGDLITIEKSNIMLGNVLLNTGDIVDQFSQGDKNGCFIAYVHQSKNPVNLGKVGNLCISNLY